MHRLLLALAWCGVVLLQCKLHCKCCAIVFVCVGGVRGGGGLWELDGVWCLVLVKVYVPVFIYIVSKLKRS